MSPKIGLVGSLSRTLTAGSSRLVSIFDWPIEEVYALSGNAPSPWRPYPRLSLAFWLALIKTSIERGLGSDFDKVSGSLALTFVVPR